MTEHPDYQHIVKAEKAAKRKAKHDTKAQRADQLIADGAAVLKANSQASSSKSGVIQPASSSDNVNRSKACSIVYIGCNEIPVALSKGITIPANS